MTKAGEGLKWIEQALLYEGDDCIAWPFAKNTHGYGLMWVDGRFEPASRYMCRRAHGEPPTPRHQATHRCGKGHLACMTKRHLRWRTASENALEKAEHGTAQIGERSTSRKLTPEQVREIRTEKHLPLSVFCRKFGVASSTVSSARRGETWAWLQA